MPAEEDRKHTARKLYLLPLAGWAAMIAAGYYPTRLLAGQSGLWAMLLAQALVALIVYATLVPAMRSMRGKSPVACFKTAMTAGVVRFLVTVFLLAVIAWQGRIHVVAFLLWGATAYMVMVMLEAVALSLWMKYLESEKRC